MGYLTGPNDLNYTVHQLADLEKADITEQLTNKAMEIYENREKTFGPELLRELERVILLKTVDTKWIDHIDAMDELRRGINLRAYGRGIQSWNIVWNALICLNEMLNRFGLIQCVCC